MNDGMGNGLHLLFEGDSFYKLVSEATVSEYLTACPDLIGMTPITEPLVLLGEAGWCGFVVIAQSHISIHAKGQYVIGDIFSCMPFEVDPALDLAGSILGLVGIRFQEVGRGWGREGVLSRSNLRTVRANTEGHGGLHRTVEASSSPPPG